MKKNALNQQKDDNQSESNYTRNNSVLVFMIRETVRDSKYLLNSKLNEKHCSIDGKTALSNDLVHFSSLAVENITSYVRSRLQGTRAEIKPIYVTMEEFNEAYSLKNITLLELKKEIFKIIELLDPDTATMQEEVFNRTILKKKKEVHIEFYYKLCEMLEDYGKSEEDEDL